jgi:hypothetical protein
MDERDMEEKGKDREEEGRGIGIKKVIFLGISWNCILCLLRVCLQGHLQLAP